MKTTTRNVNNHSHSGMVSGCKSFRQSQLCFDVGNWDLYANR